MRLMAGVPDSEDTGVQKARPSEAKGKPLVRAGRKATDLNEEAELPDRRQMRSWRVIAN
jgi:hypothetical protein